MTNTLQNNDLVLISLGVDYNFSIFTIKFNYNLL